MCVRCQAATCLLPAGCDECCRQLSAVSRCVVLTENHSATQNQATNQSTIYNRLLAGPDLLQIRVYLAVAEGVIAVSTVCQTVCAQTLLLCPMYPTLPLNHSGNHR